MPHGARLPLFARLVAAVTFAACFVALAPAAHAVEIQVETLQDSLAQPPAPLSNVCTLRKAVNNANDNNIPYPQCQSGEASPVVDSIVFNVPGTITFALAGANEEGGETGDLDVTDNLTIIGHPDGTTIDAADLDRVFHVHPGVTLTLVNIHITSGNGGGVRVEAGATLNLNGVTILSCHAPNGDGGDAGAFEVQGACVTNVPAAPAAVDDNAAVNEDSGANVINVLANDTDANADPLTVIAVTQGAHGSVSNNGNSVSYTPNANYFGPDSFTYTITDSVTGSDTATVNVSVASQRHAGARR